MSEASLPDPTRYGPDAWAEAAHTRLTTSGKRRAQGSYYTPWALARCLTEWALGPLARAQDPRTLRVLDPTVGGGVFLLAALDVLTCAWLERGGDVRQWRAARADMAARCLYGADLDPDAIGLTRAVLQAATEPGLELPNLQVAHALTEWDEAWSGFDVVLGNPPYRREKGRPVDPETAAGPWGHWARARGDAWLPFAHMALDRTRPGGRHAFVVPSYWLRARGAGPSSFRARLRAEASLDGLLDVSRVSVFSGAAVRTVGYVVRKDVAQAEAQVVSVPAKTSLRTCSALPPRTVPAEAVWGPGETVWADRDVSPALRAALERLRGALPEGWSLSEGVTANPERVGSRGVFVVDAPPATLNGREQALLLPWLGPEEVGRGRVAWGTRRLIYSTAETWAEEGDCPNWVGHLRPWRERLERRREVGTGRRAWFHLHWPRRPELFRGPRVLIPRWTRWPSAAWTDAPGAVGESTLVLVPSDPAWAKVAAGLLGSAPAALSLRLGAKDRGKGADLARADVAGLAWPRLALPEERGWSAGWRSRQEALGVVRAAWRELLERFAEDVRRWEGPWWAHPQDGVRAVGEALDRAACAVWGVEYEVIRAGERAVEPRPWDGVR